MLLEAHDKLTYGMASVKDVKRLFADLLGAIKDLRASVRNEIEKCDSELAEIGESMMSKVSSMERELKKMVSDSDKKSDQKCKKNLDYLGSEIRKIEKELNKIPNITPLQSEIFDIKSIISEFKDSSATRLKDSDKRIDQIKKYFDDSLRSLDSELREFIKSQPTKQIEVRPIIGGRPGIQLYYNGTKVGTKVAEIDFRNGLYAYELDGRITVISQASGSVLSATGTVNGTNTTFTFTTEPSYIVSDGVAYRKTSKNNTVYWTWDSNTLTATLTIPPTDEIFGVR